MATSVGPDTERTVRMPPRFAVDSGNARAERRLGPSASDAMVLQYCSESRTVNYPSRTARIRARRGLQWCLPRPNKLRCIGLLLPVLGRAEERKCSAPWHPRRWKKCRRLHALPMSTGCRFILYPRAAISVTEAQLLPCRSVVLDLKRMNRILEVDERNAFALVEPGVSYIDLRNYIHSHGLSSGSMPGTGWGSPLAIHWYGSGFTRVDFRNHFEAHCAWNGAREWRFGAHGWAPCRVRSVGNTTSTVGQP